MKTLFVVVCGIVDVLGLDSASYAQPPGLTREMIATALPVEGAPLVEAGPYKVVSEPAFGSPGHVVFRPADLERFPVRDTLPVMVWGNGGCAINSTRYGGFLTTIASHGFLGVASSPVSPELAAVAVQKRQDGRQDVRRKRLRTLQESELGYASQENGVNGRG